MIRSLKSTNDTQLNQGNHGHPLLPGDIVRPFPTGHALEYLLRRGREQMIPGPRRDVALPVDDQHLSSSRLRSQV